MTIDFLLSHTILYPTISSREVTTGFYSPWTKLICRTDGKEEQHRQWVAAQRNTGHSIEECEQEKEELKRKWNGNPLNINAGGGGIFKESYYYCPLPFPTNKQREDQSVVFHLSVYPEHMYTFSVSYWIINQPCFLPYMRKLFFPLKMLAVYLMRNVFFTVNN